MFYLTTHSTHFIYGYLAFDMVKDHSVSERVNPLGDLGNVEEKLPLTELSSLIYTYQPLIKSRNEPDMGKLCAVCFITINDRTEIQICAHGFYSILVFHLQYRPYLLKISVLSAAGWCFPHACFVCMQCTM